MVSESFKHSHGKRVNEICKMCAWMRIEMNGIVSERLLFGIGREQAAYAVDDSAFNHIIMKFRFNNV